MHTHTTSIVELVTDRTTFDESEIAAAAFLARYNGRTLDAYRQDLRSFFTWAAGVGLEVLTATRPHIELYRQHMDQHGLAASTIDRRLSTVCGFYKFAHIDGRIATNPAQYVRRPKVHPAEGRGLDRGELARFLFTAERIDHQHAALAVLLGLNGLRVTEACQTNRRPRLRPRSPHPAHHRQRQQARADPTRATHGTHHRPRHRRTPRRPDPRPPRRTTHRPSIGAHRWVRSIGKHAGIGALHPHMLRAAFIMAALDAGVPLRDVQIAARHADPRTTTIYDRRRENFDRHAAYVVVAFVTGN